MKKLILLLAFVAISQSMVYSQGCLPEGITFTTQEQIDNFQANFPGCTEIEGDVLINEAYSGDITNLNGLSVLTTIGGWFSIGANHSLANLIGLDGLTSIGGAFYIAFNGSLTSLTGIEGLTSIGTYLKISDNDALTSLSGLNGLTSIGSDLNIELNNVLTSLTGLEGLNDIGGDLYIFLNNSLTTLTALGGLSSIEGNIQILFNYDLTSLTGLEGLTTIGGDIAIHSNNSLTSLVGIDNIQPNSIDDLTISDNPLLYLCNVFSICEYLTVPGGEIYIGDNAPGCNSPEEVEAACLTSVKGNIINNEFSLFPNPATSFITIDINGGQPIEEAIIYNHLGQKALVAVPVNNTVDVSGLTPGIYFIEVATKDWKGRTKLVKQ